MRPSPPALVQRQPDELVVDPSAVAPVAALGTHVKVHVLLFKAGAEDSGKKTNL